MSNKKKRRWERINAARERRRLETPVTYPVELPKLRRRIIVIDYDFGERRYEMRLYRTGRRDCYKAVIKGRVWCERIGWSRILEAIRLAFPAVGAYE